MSLVVPEGALSNDVYVTVDAVPEPPPATGLIDGTIFEYGPADVSFSVPAQLSV